MKGSELRDRERKKEILQMFRPKKNGCFVYKGCTQNFTVGRYSRSGKVRVWTKKEIKNFV